MVPLERVVFIINESTDQRLLARTLQSAESSPVVFKLQSMRLRELRRLLLALAMAAEPSPGRA